MDVAIATAMAVWDGLFETRLARWGYPAMVVALATFVVWVWMSTQRETNISASSTADPSAGELACEAVTRTRLPVLPEASGLAISARTPDVLWSLNDSSAPNVIALNSAGKALSSVHITGASVNNWEDVSVAPCENGSCLYVADGGNPGGTQRNDIVIYRVREPLPDDKKTAPADAFDATYPDGEDHEAEAVFVVNRQLFLITKGHPSLLFRFPEEMDTSSLATLERVGEIPTERFLRTTIPRRTRVTDAETSPDGNWVAIRTNEDLLVYRSSDLVAHRMSAFWHANLKSLDEPQGEGVAISNIGDVYLAGEGGGQQPGTFVHMKCTLPH